MGLRTNIKRCIGYSKYETGELVINEEEAVVVRRIFDFYLSGYSVDMIIQELSAKSIKSPKGKDTWAKGSIQKMLTNEKYIGNVTLGKHIQDSFLITSKK